MREINKYICFGLLINGFWLFSKQFFQLPEFVNGFCAGLGITLILWGAYIQNHDITKIKKLKRNLFIKLRNL